MEDREIVMLFLSRSETAIEKTQDKYSSYLFAVADNILSSPEDSHEIVNDTYIALWNAIPPERPDSLKFETLKLHRPIYGGGGIMPDIFIPSDTTGINSFFASMIRRGLLTDYANEYCDRNHDKVIYGDFDKFYAAYPSFEPEILEGLYDYCSSHGLASYESQRAVCESLVKTRLKALVAKASFGMTGYFRVINQEEDPDFQKALEVIREWKIKKMPSIFREP